MKPEMRSFSGKFRVLEALPGGGGIPAPWRLASDAPAGPEIYLHGADEGEAEALRGILLHSVELEWLEQGVRLTLHSAAGARVVRAQAAVVHEPMANLYDVLPLARLDPSARRFWRWVFRLVRFPGGRYLLALVARRARPRAPK